MKVEFSGPEEGVGAKQSWEGKSSGRGSMKSLSADPQEGIRYAFSFDGNPSTGGIGFFPGPDSTLVAWYADGDLGMNPLPATLACNGRFMGPDFRAGLINLRRG